MPYVNKVQQREIGGFAAGLGFQAVFAPRQAHHHFGDKVAVGNVPWLARISKPAVLRNVGEMPLDYAGGAA